MKMLFINKKHTCKILAGIGLLLSYNLAAAAGFDDSKTSHVEFPDWFVDNPFHELNEDLKSAVTNGKQGLMIVYTTEGCSYCVKFVKEHLSDPVIVGRIQKHFDSVGMEIFNDADLVDLQGRKMTVKEFAQQEGVMFSPTILFYGKDGKKLLRITGYQSQERFKTSLSYVIGGYYRSQSLAEFSESLNRNKTTSRTAVKLKQDTLFAKPPYLLQRNVVPASQPLLVIFEKTGNSEVEDFHNVVLASKDVRNTLAKFEVVRLNANDNKMILITPDGKRTTPANWYRQNGFSRVPAMMTFDEKGREAIKTDTLVLRNRMMNSLNYTLERAHLKGWSYQRFARSKAIERNQKKKIATK
jgi:thioredoxin-related protein